MDKEKINSIIGIFFILFLFIFFSYLVQNHLSFFEKYLDIGIIGMLLFVFIVALSIVLPPVSSIPLFPVGSALWGWMMTGLLGVIGWTLGAIIAFILARKYGVSLVRKVLPIKQIYRLENKIPEKNLFWIVICLRMIIPVDGVSYIIGLFTKMKFRPYLVATIIGLIPFSFMTAYLGTVPFYYQIVFLLIALMIFFITVLIGYCIKKRKSIN